MRKVTRRRFNQSAKQLVVGQTTTIASIYAIHATLTDPPHHLGKGQASFFGPLAKAEARWAEARGPKPLKGFFACILEAPDGLFWNLLGPSSGGMGPLGPLKFAYGMRCKVDESNVPE